MDSVTLGLIILVFLTTIIGMVWSFRLGQSQKSEYDADINEHVKQHPISRNPIFIAYGVAALLTIGYIFYMILFAY